MDAPDSLEATSEMSAVEHAARFLVQKIAREHAAYHTATVFRLEHRDSLGDPRVKARVLRLARRAHSARYNREIAVVALRVELGLPETPTQIEVEGWGEAP